MNVIRNMQSGHHVRLRLLLSTAAWLALTSIAAQAQVIPDGASATGVTTDPASGRATVAIAPPTNASGISHNTYTSFSVDPAGVDLDNRSVGASTILNEVTSARVSHLNGPLSVLGERAHVIIANPNGISVDGGRFVNTGGVVLSTGTPSIVARPATPGYSQDNVVLETGAGRIDVGPGGLSGAMTSLQLIASQIRVDGPVENSSSNRRSDIRLIGGGSRVEYDSSVLPIADLEGWGKLEERAVSDDGVAVEITERGALKGNTIRIKATNRGAGVSHAGQSLASSGDFLIDASGKVTTRGGSIKAAKNIRIAAGSVDMASIKGQPQATIEAIDGALTLLGSAGAITNIGVKMSGARRDQADPASKGGVTLNSAAGIALSSDDAGRLAIVFSDKDDVVVAAGGDVTVAGGIVRAARNLDISAQSIRSASISGQEQSAIEAMGGALTLTAASGDIANTGVKMTGVRRNPANSASTGGVTLTSAGDISLLTDNPEQLAVVFSAGDDLVVEAGGNVVNDTGRFLSNATTSITAGGNVDNVTDMTLVAGTIGEWVSEVHSGNRLWYTFWTSRERTETISVNFGDPRIANQQAYITGDSVVINAAGTLTNRASTINANDGNIEINAKAIDNVALASGSLSFSKTCGFTCIGYGHSDINLVGGGINASGDIHLIAGTTIRNKGGQILGLGDTVLTADEVLFEAVRVPSVYTRPPGLYNFWSGSSAWIAATDEGGLLLSPQGSITIDAFKPVVVNAGRIEAKGGVSIPNGQAPAVAPWSGYPFGKDRIDLFRHMTGGK